MAPTNELESGAPEPVHTCQGLLILHIRGEHQRAGRAISRPQLPQQLMRRPASLCPEAP